jgi:hypothetical protein
MISYKCRGCGLDLDAPLSLVGEMERCPVCGKANIVPGDGPRLRASMLRYCIMGIVILTVVVTACTVTYSIARRPAANPPAAQVPTVSPSPAVERLPARTSSRATTRVRDLDAMLDALPPRSTPATYPSVAAKSHAATPRAGATSKTVDEILDEAMAVPDSQPVSLTPQELFARTSPAVVQVIALSADGAAISFGSKETRDSHRIYEVE